MVDWAKKIRKHVGGDVPTDEPLEAGLFVQPGGFTGALMGRELGGIAGHAMAFRSQNRKDNAQGIERDDGRAASIPNANTVIGLTPRRMLFWSHSRMTGRPKDLIGNVPLTDVAGISMEEQKLTYAMVIRFADGSAVVFEAPKIGKPDRFADAFARVAPSS